MIKSTMLTGSVSLHLIVSALAQNPNAFNNQPSEESSHSVEREESKSPYGNEIPTFDLENERINSSLGDFDLNDNRFADQFLGYLVLPPTEEKAANNYAEIISEILNVLAHDNKLKRMDKLQKLYHHLGLTAKYPDDAGISSAFRNAIAMTLSTQRSVKKINAENKRLDRLHQTLVRKAYLEERKRKPSAVKQTDNLRQRTETLAKKAANEVKKVTSEAMSRVQFQAFLMQLYAQRKYEHCVIGCRVYNILFTDGENQLKIEEDSDLSKLFKDVLGVKPTVAGLDALSNESIKKIKDLVRFSENHIARNEIDAASKRLSEAYFGGEHLSAVQLVPANTKNAIAKYVNNGKNLKDAVTSRNWQEAERLVKAMQSNAKDFRYLKPLTAIAGHKTASNGKLIMYYQSAAKHNIEAANLHLEKAHKLWPTNPKITGEMKRRFNLIEKTLAQSETLIQKAEEFKTIVRNESFDTLTVEDAGIYKQYFKAAKSDPLLDEAKQDDYSELFDKASDIMAKIISVDTAIARANELTAKSQHEAAWESMALEQQKGHIAKRRIQDKLNDLGNRAAIYRDFFNKADTHIERKNFGSALSFYLEARSLNPQSQLAKEGIQKMIEMRAKN